MVMDAKLTALEVLIPAVENAVAAPPSPTRYLKSLQGNDGGNRQYRRRGTAGAGRRMALADEEKPDLLAISAP